MSGMLSTISNVLTTAVKSQKRIWPLNHAMTVCHLSAKTEAATSNRSFVFFIVILIMCNIRMKKSFVRTIILHFVCEYIAQTHRTCIWECKATIKKHHDLSKTESKELFQSCSDFSNAEIGEIESQQYTAQTKARAKSGERSVCRKTI